MKSFSDLKIQISNHPLSLWLSERLAAPWAYPLFLFTAGFLTYLYPLTQLGYFWDDWEVVYLTRLASPAVLEGYFFFDRPLAWPYTLYYALLGSTPFLWHLLTLLLRWAGVYFFYHAFALVWPRQRSALQWAGLFLMVYPAFTQQTVSTAFSRHFTSFMLCGLSFYFTALALRTRRGRFFWPLAWLTAVLQIFTIEYFAGLELARPVFIWLALAQLPARERAKRTLWAWLPFLSIFLAFGWWRVLRYPSLLPIGRYASRPELLTNLRANLLPTLAQLFQTVYMDFMFVVVKSWNSLLTNSDWVDFRAAALWAGVLLAGVVALLAAWFLQNAEKPEERDIFSLLFLGLVLFLTGGIPVWLIGRSVGGNGSWDNRFAVSLALGAAVIVAALIQLLVRTRWRRVIFTLFLLAGVVTQFLVVNTYRRDWANQRNFFWQLAWRAPQVQPGTPILSGYVPSPNLPDYDASFALSLLYASSPTGTQLPFWYYNWESLGNANLKPGKDLHVAFRNLVFDGQADHALLLMSQPAPGCLRVIDSLYANDPAIGALTQLISYSDLQRIQPEASYSPPGVIFGPEPAHGWCYFFQKADLARQAGQWPQVIDLYRQAAKAGYLPSQGGEYLPLIEACAQSGQWKLAYETSRKALALNGEMTTNLCGNWARYAQLPGADSAVLRQARAAFACP